MTRNRIYRKLVITAVAAVGGLSLSVSGCANSQKTAEGSGDQAATETVASSKGSSQMWAENCAHCHNIRDPGEFSDAQWSVIVHHMRLQGNLTGREQREITKLMQASNN